MLNKYSCSHSLFEKLKYKVLHSLFTGKPTAFMHKIFEKYDLLFESNNSLCVYSSLQI